LTVLGFTRAALLDVSDRTERTFLVPADELDNVGRSTARAELQRLFPDTRVDFFAERSDLALTSIPLTAPPRS
jgi:hypothetical protein